MTTQFIIGHVDKKPLKVDAFTLADTRGIICASSGAGKSFALRLIAERVALSIQTIIIDPEGEFATLREKVDLLVVGENGDLRADVRSAGLLARRLAETGVSAVIDIYDLPGRGDPWDKRRAFLAEFITSLMNLPKSAYHPMLIMVDEAHNFAPEEARGELSLKSRSAINNLMSAGRKRGFGGILATQRISKIHKDSIADARNVFIGGTTLDIDQVRAGDMLGMSKADRIGLRELRPGEFYCFGPAIEDKGVIRFMTDQVKTTHPKAGQRSSITVPKASTHISSIVEQFGDLPAEALAEVETSESLKRENVRLRAELKARPVQEVSPTMQVTETVEVEVPVFGNGEIEGLASLILALNEIGSGLISNVNDIKQASADIAQAVQRAKLMQQKQSAAPRFIQQPIQKNLRVATSAPMPETYRPPAGTDSKLAKAEKKILTALAQYPQGRTKVQVAILSGYAVTGGGFNNAVGALRSSGFISGDKDQLSITQEGLVALGNGWEPLPTGIALYQHWYHQLPKAERSILNVLVQVYPDLLTKEEIASQSGYEVSGGGFNNAIGKLRTLELIEGRMNIKASDALF